MKKTVLYILGAVIILAIVGLIAGQKDDAQQKKMNYRPTLRKRDKIPYGTFVAHQSLKDLFPQATQITEAVEPSKWDSLSVYESDQALFILTPHFYPSDEDMKVLIRFIEIGNDVFISAADMSSVVETYTKAATVSGFGFFIDLPFRDPDSLSVSLFNPVKGESEWYSYPGHAEARWFSNFSERETEVLGYAEEGRPNFIRLRAGKGSLFLHTAPMAFTNYFLLHKNNLDYYERALSLINKNTKKVAWDEYYIGRREDKPKTGWLSTLMNMENSEGKKSFRLAIWIALALLGLYVLMEMRRKQRVIPVIKQPANESLQFVKTIGRLYHDKGDHHNLARKMCAYFLEYVRTRYNLPTSRLDAAFVAGLHFKSGVPEPEISSIVGFIRDLDGVQLLSAKDLASLHNQLETFYSKA